MNKYSQGFLAHCKDILCILLYKSLRYFWETAIKGRGVIYKKYEQMGQCLISVLPRQEDIIEMRQSQQTCDNISKIVKYSLESFDVYLT